MGGSPQLGTHTPTQTQTQAMGMKHKQSPRRLSAGCGLHRCRAQLQEARAALARWPASARPPCETRGLVNSGAPVVILELADIRIQPGQQAAFDEAIQRGLSTVISRAHGFKGWKVNKGIESPERYILQIFWETLEDHTVTFRGGPLFAEWRAIVGPFFAAPPVVEHFELLGKSA
jgi:heme-degrading monooxygenase HmoA